MVCSVCDTDPLKNTDDEKTKIFRRSKRIQSQKVMGKINMNSWIRALNENNMYNMYMREHSLSNVKQTNHAKELHSIKEIFKKSYK